MKLLYLVLNHAAEQWKRPPREWFEAETRSPSHSAKGSSASDGNGLQAQNIRQSQKNDVTDAEAICEAVTRPMMCFVPVKICLPDGRTRQQPHRENHPADHVQSEERTLRRERRRAQNWATVPSLIGTCKLHAVDPQARLTVTLTAIVNGHKQSNVDDLLPWNHRPACD